MATTEQKLLGLILTGMSVLAVPAAQEEQEEDDARATAAMGGTLHVGGLVLGVAACGEGEGDSGGADTAAGPSEEEEDDEPIGGSDTAGRPFTVASGTRTAPLWARGDWSKRVTVERRPADPALCTALCRYFRRLGAAEHASVASFHRAALELMHLGAPADLLEETHRAAADEVRHARIAYGLAAFFGGSAVGPGPLDVSDALDVDLSPAGVLARVADEACAQETVSALVLTEASRRCTDAGLADTLARIAREEEEHAALGWATLRWLLDAHPELRGLARERIMAALDTPARGHADARLEAWGVLSRETWGQVRDRALVGVVLPALNAAA